MATEVSKQRVQVSRPVKTVADLKAYVAELEREDAPLETQVRVGNWQISAEWERAPIAWRQA